MLFVFTMTTAHKQKSSAWRNAKSKIILRFGSITLAARHYRVHPNSIRLAAEGQCPHVAKALLRDGILEQEVA